MRILVTGGAGFIGSHLVDRLLADQHQVTALDNFDPFYAESQKRANLRDACSRRAFRLAEHDIRDADAIRNEVSTFRPETIVHLAARAGVRPSIESPALYMHVNVLGTTHLLDAAVRLDPMPRFVYASSSSVYGDRPDAPFREDDRVDQPISPYAASKKACELLAYTYHHLHGLAVTGLRFFTAYGPRNRPDLAISRFARLIDRGEPVPMYGDGTTLRDYTYVGDVVEGVVRAIDRCRSHHLYNLGNSRPVALRDMIETLASALGRPARVQQLPEQPGDVRMTCADTTRAEAELGFRPHTPLPEGLERFVAWFRGAGGT